MKKEKQFPTIKEMCETLYSMNSDLRDVTYVEENNTFSYIELIPYPVRDSGGSIDSVGFKEVSGKLTFQQAYSLWEEFNHRCEEFYEEFNNSWNDEIVHPERYEVVYPSPDFEDDLPF